MAEIVRMPKLSDTMTEGTVAAWHKKVGDKVKSGELLAEIETDKATMEFESYVDGVLLYIGVEKGKTVAVDALLAVFGKEGEDVSAIVAAEGAAPAAKEEAPVAVAPAPSAPVVEAPKPVAPAAVAPVSTPASAPKPVNDGRMRVSPLAKKLAEDKGLPLQYIPGSGDGGRIVRRDIDAFMAGAAVQSANAVESYTEENVSQMRKTIARRLAESKFTAPHFYLTMEIDMGRAVEARAAMNAATGSKVSFNDMVIKATSLALKQHPKVNSSWRGDTIRYNHHVHMGVAVAVDEGLLVPVVRFSDTKTLAQINQEVKVFVDKAKNKKLQPSDWEGNTFTISNLGMFGIEEFTAIVNPPDACILAVGAIREVPVVKNGTVVPGHTMKLTLSCDHRVVDGASGSAFLQTLKAMLEEPVLMFI
ncbi:MAG: 2-oxo acid dehydrogenase subunit E2 [Flavobacteriales bacterium]|jgi:pyruvate dehydrogenase E2 component (dihydrolipoamide acetyltransferase)|nr:2-oxo acid dehydrogenase subunit E2 [Flavobacteriales bacterium]MDP4716511.1 2-oxo acid dehydrogenase subunit E2 [Flavobacteriales bacterium]MDP4819152.1 2-oxo acid dehydrogenase subunit E2 [Flavobacteriales bacterium]MDP4950506.1 2-oxo acid dehydrogenase subunit E2 [Flavobacteriales bacterium]MDP5076136.1 2-oxo acid dehydrogenase subunit E2 [Flavobacteriales bacterium]